MTSANYETHNVTRVERARFIHGQDKPTQAPCSILEDKSIIVRGDHCRRRAAIVLS